MDLEDRYRVPQIFDLSTGSVCFQDFFCKADTYFDKPKQQVLKEWTAACVWVLILQTTSRAALNSSLHVYML